MNCEALTSVTIPNTVTSIGSGAFSSCKSLPSIAIPNTVTNIGESAFSLCSALKSFTFPDNNSITSIEEKTFLATGLTSITIPNTVKSIGNNAFAECPALKSVTLKGGTPPTINIDSWPGTFSDTPLNAIYVPANSVETYKKADGWNKFADKIQAIK